MHQRSAFSIFLFTFYKIPPPVFSEHYKCFCFLSTAFFCETCSCIIASPPPPIRAWIEEVLGRCWFEPGENGVQGARRMHCLPTTPRDIMDGVGALGLATYILAMGSSDRVADYMSFSTGDERERERERERLPDCIRKYVPN